MLVKGATEGLIQADYVDAGGNGDMFMLVVLKLL